MLFRSEATSSILGASRFGIDGDLTDLAASVLGAITVLVAGTIWRRRKLGAEHGKVQQARAAE